MLAHIVSESMSNGGGPYNVLKDLAALEVSFPLEAAGLVGDDANGQWIRQDCDRHNIDSRQLRTTRDAATSYTDAMCVQSNGRRTFFHQLGANALLAEDHIDLTSSRAKIFVLAYLLLLETLDCLDRDSGTGASHLLERARELGFITAVDLVSSPEPDYRQVVTASLPNSDIFFSNEVEAALILEEQIGTDAASLEYAAQKIATLGSPGRIVVHSGVGAVCRQHDGRVFHQPALRLPQAFMKGSTGAGDAFTAGFLSGVHDENDAAECLLRGVCVAAASLSHPSSSQGVLPLQECLNLAERFGFQQS